MPGLSHPTSQKSASLSIPDLWPLNQVKPGQAETVPQIIAEDQPLPPSQRLVVILPDVNFDVFPLGKLIWDLASPAHRQVVLMIRPSHEENEFQARINSSTLAAIIQDSGIIVETHLVLGQSLVQAVSNYAQPEDLFVCFEGHQEGGLFKKSQVAEMVARSTQLPVYLLRGPIPEVAESVPARLIDFLLLAACLVSLVAFFALEVWIDRISSGALHAVLQILAVLVEVWIIGKLASRPF